MQQKRLYRSNLGVFERKSFNHLAAALFWFRYHRHTPHVTVNAAAGSLATLLPFSAPGKFART
jgi:hypothetical protein